jgi:hypothetical protein
MKHTKVEQRSLALTSLHRELLEDIELVADRANMARRDPAPAAKGIVEAAEVAHVRLMAGWRDSRGGREANAFFNPLSRRLRRIIRTYRRYGVAATPAVPEGDRWLYRILDFERLPFDRLKPFFRASAVDDAIKTGITLGLRELPGLTIYEDTIDD